MKYGETADRNRQKDNQDDENNRDDRGKIGEVRSNPDEVIDRERENDEHVDQQAEQKVNEVVVVPSTDAVVQPRTVMVEGVDAKVAN